MSTLLSFFTLTRFSMSCHASEVKQFRTEYMSTCLSSTAFDTFSGLDSTCISSISSPLVAFSSTRSSTNQRNITETILKNKSLCKKTLPPKGRSTVTGNLRFTHIIWEQHLKKIQLSFSLMGAVTWRIGDPFDSDRLCLQKVLLPSGGDPSDLFVLMPMASLDRRQKGWHWKICNNDLP